MDIILTIFYTILFIFLIYRSKFFNLTGIETHKLVFLFVIKIISGISLILVYIYFYNTRSTADVFNYFDDGNVLFSALKTNPSDYFKMLTGIGSRSEHLMKYYNEMGFWIKEFNYNLYNDNRTVIRLNAFIRFFSFGSIYVHSVFFTFISFVGLTAIYKVFSDKLKINKGLIAITVYLIPSVLFWTSSVLKESVLMFSFGLLFYSIFKLINKPKLISIYFLAVFCILILLLLKFYILIAAIPGFLSIIVFQLVKNKFRIVWFFIVHVFVFIILFNIQIISNKYNFIEIIVNKQNDFITYVESLEQVGSKIDIPELEPSFKSILINTPNAIFNVFFRPFIWEVNSIFSLLSGLENLLIIGIILIALFYRKSDYRANGLIYFSISFTLILFVLIGLTTPVIGALVRYKVPALPFLLIIFFDLIDIDKLKLCKNIVLQNNIYILKPHS